MFGKVSRRFERLIPAYLEGTLTDRQWRWFQRQLQRSEACRQELERYQNLYRYLRHVRVEYPDPQALRDFLPRLHERIAQEAPANPQALEKPHNWTHSVSQVLLGGSLGSLVGAAIALTVVFGLQRIGLLPGVENASLRAVASSQTTVDSDWRERLDTATGWEGSVLAATGIGEWPERTTESSSNALSPTGIRPKTAQTTPQESHSVTTGPSPWELAILSPIELYFQEGEESGSLAALHP